MNLPCIQSEIFRQLVDMEPLLKPKYRFNITKLPTGRFQCFLWDRKRQLHANYPVRLIDTSTIYTPDQITAEINRIWQAIPAECKKDTLK